MIEDNELLKLGNYGDTIQFADKTKDSSLLEEAYTSLQKEVKASSKGVFEEKYRQGLLDFFDIHHKIKITIDIREEELKLLNEDYRTGNKETYRSCNLDILLDDIIFHYEEVGIRQKGNTSRGVILDDKGNINLRHYKLSFSETFDDEFRENPKEWSDKEALAYRDSRNFFGIEKLNLRWNRNQEGTYIREYYAFEMYRKNGVLAPHSNPIQVEIKIGEDIQGLGVYLAVEDVDKSFLKRNLISSSVGGDLYKLGWTNVGARLDSIEDNLFGVEKQVLENGKYKTIAYPYDLKTNKKTSTNETIKDFISKLLMTSTSAFSDFLKKNTLYDEVISYFSVSYLLGDPDDLRGNFNNTYLYFTSDTKQALFIPTDNDRALGSTGSAGNNPTAHYGALSLPFDSQTGYSKNDMPLFTKSILENGNKKIRIDYMNRIQEIINEKWLDIETFKDYYTLVKNNYSNCLKLGNRINGNPVSFSLGGETLLNKEGNLSIEVYFNTKKKTCLEFDWNPDDIVEVDYSFYYLRGQMNDWDGITEKYCLKMMNGIPFIEVELHQGEEFKIADSGWKRELNYDDLIDKKAFLSVGSNKNIGVKESGLYLIQVLDYLTDPKLSVIKK